MSARPSAAARLRANGYASPADVPLPFRDDADFHGPHAPPLEADEQDWAAFLGDSDRNGATAARRTLIVVPLGWSDAADALRPHSAVDAPLPSPADVAAYLSAFTTLPCRLAPELPVVAWSPPSARHRAVQVGDVLVCVRARRAPDAEFATQLHVCDLLDALLECVEAYPDAYSLVGVTPFDIHEDGQLVCGRAFGGSRVAVVSAARYHPAFASADLPDWPTSLGARVRGGPLLSAARAAASAAAAAARATPSATWLSQFAVTAAHEVGHCMGLDHCTAYACWMGELEGQPPYACPGCLRKLLTTAAGDEGAGGGAAALDVAAAAHYTQLSRFCAAPLRRDVPLWAALHAWAAGRAAALAAAATEVKERCLEDDGDAVAPKAQGEGGRKRGGCGREDGQMPRRVLNKQA
jgi:archaemetzincin